MITRSKADMYGKYRRNEVIVNISDFNDKRLLVVIMTIAR